VGRRYHPTPVVRDHGGMPRHNGGDLPVEWIDDGEATKEVPPPRSSWRWRRWYPLLIAMIIVAIVAVSLLSGGDSKPAGSRHPFATSIFPAPPVSATTAAPSILPVETTDIGRPLLSVPPDWELFGRGRDLVRIQLRAGRITRTAIPPLQSSGPVYLVVGRDRAIVRPLDFVPGYVAPDGQPAMPLTGPLGDGGPAFPGPDPDHLWVLTGTSERRMQLVSFEGTPSALSIPISDGFPVSDGSGYLLVSSTGGIYLARPDGLTRVTTGSLLAAGPTRWLTTECDVHQRCSLVVTNRATGIARTLGPSGPEPGGMQPGVVSPDGSTAAVKRETPTGAVLHLIDLTSGHDHPIEAPVGAPDQADMVWTPDSRLLFFVDRDGHLEIIDARGTQLRDLGIALPAISQLALRVGRPTP
jgi:hypothetical protein